MSGFEKFLSPYERALLSLAYREKTVLLELQHRLTADYFLYPPHKIIYSALSRLIANPDVDRIDVESLFIECESLGIKKLNVNMDYILLVAEGAFDPANFEFYFEKVRDAYLKFELSLRLQAANDTLVRNAGDDPKAKSAQELLENVGTQVSNLINFEGKKEEGISVAERVEQYVLERAANPTDVMGVRTGFPTLDVAINGLMPGTLTVIAGQAKAGKSAVMMNMADYIGIESQSPLPVLVISTEMYTDEDISRLLAMRTLVPERKIANGVAYNDPKLKKILQAGITQIKKGNIYHVYMPFFNAQKVTNLISYYKLKYNIGIAFFDYIKMSTTGDAERDKREDQILGDTTAALKNIAGALHIPVVTGCQVNTRSGRVADSDRIIRYCNTLMEFKPKSAEELAAQPFHKHGTHWLHVYTTRGGGNGKIPIRFWKACLKLQEAEPFEEENEAADNNQALLTTPLEWEEMKAKEFAVEAVATVVQTKDGFDLRQEDAIRQEMEKDPYF